MEFDAETVGELLEQLQKLDPAMPIYGRKGMGALAPFFSFEVIGAMKHKDPSENYTTPADSHVFAKRRNKDFGPTFKALVIG